MSRKPKQARKTKQDNAFVDSGTHRNGRERNNSQFCKNGAEKSFLEPEFFWGISNSAMLNTLKCEKKQRKSNS